MKEFQINLQPHVQQLIEEYTLQNRQQVMGGILLGQANPDGSQIDITGVIKAVHKESFLKEIHFDHQIWREIYRLKGLNYPNLTIIGWFHTCPGKPLIPSEQDYGVQRAFFQELHQVLLLIDPMNAQSCIFHWQNQFLVANADFFADSTEPSFSEDRSSEDPSQYQELAKKAQELLQHSSQISSNIGAMLDNRGTTAEENEAASGIGTGIAISSSHNTAGATEITTSMSTGLKAIAIISTLLTATLFLIYPIIKPVTSQPKLQPLNATAELQKVDEAKITPITNKLSKAPALSTTVQPKPTVTATPANQQTYTIQSGDSLWDISTQFYGSGFEFYKIIQANKIINPNSLHVGTVITIPE